MKFDFLSALIGFLVAVVLFMLRSHMSFYTVPDMSSMTSTEQLTTAYEGELKKLSDELETKNKDATPEDIKKNQDEFAAGQMALTSAYSEAMMKLAPVA
jgi:uncharacterized membrane protein required for colicin V production